MVVVLALVACLGFCIYKKCFNKAKKPKKVRERKGGRGRRKKDKDGEEGEEKKVGLVHGHMGILLLVWKTLKLRVIYLKLSKLKKTRATFPHCWYSLKFWEMRLFAFFSEVG